MIRVVKCGGQVLDDDALLEAFCRDFAALPGPKVLVHGGGALAGKFQKALGIEPVKYEGRRVTDEATLQVVTMVYAGWCNKRVVSLLQADGCNAIGLSGCDGSVITASKRPPIALSDGRVVDFGQVGDVTPASVRTDFLRLLLDNGLTPVLCAINHDGAGQLLNTNADTVAASVAAAVELSVVELEDRVKTEGYDNVALEEGHDGEDDRNEDVDVASEDIQQNDREDGQDDYAYSEDDIPVYTPSTGRNYEETMPIGDTKSFIEDLKRQIYDFNITPKQQELIEYLIGTLDDRGFIDRPLASIADDLLFHFNIDADLAEVEEAMKILQQFEPAGIGARNLQECLTIQLDRKLENCSDEVRKARLLLERDIIQNHFDVLQHQHIEQLVKLTQASPEQVTKAIEGIRKLNPRPGLALSESADERAQTIEPDFIIETTPDGLISVELNNGEVPELRVSRSYEQQLQQYQKHADKMTRAQQDAFEYTRKKVEGAKLFIEAIKQRQHTLYSTMKAIVKLQKDFILTQDESLLRPMRLVDVAELTGQDISTVSRVRKGKYALIDGQLYALDFFFLRTRTNADGETLEHKIIKERIREIIDQEDKSKPIPDQKIVELLLAENHNISRRTVAKYRSEMGILSTSERRRV